MANLRLIKRRIRTTKNIAQITRAMEMVAALKMRKAQEQALESRPYTEKAHLVLANLAQDTQLTAHPLFLSPKVKNSHQKIALFLITPNRGLCGSLSTNLFREILVFKMRQQEKEQIFLNYGKKGRDFLVGQNFSLLADFEAPEPPSFSRAVDILRVLKEGFLNGEFQKVFLAYTHFESVMRQQPTVSPLLPLSESILEMEKAPSVFNFEYLFEPASAVLLEAFLPHFLEMKIYHALLESFASEQVARMMSMRQATENAKEIMAELTLSYNKERQQVITGEISDIVTAQLGLEAK